MHDVIGPRGAGVFFFLLCMARGRRSFIMEPHDILPLFSEMNRDLFDDLVEQLVDARLISTMTAAYGATHWTILRCPPEWAVTKN